MPCINGVVPDKETSTGRKEHLFSPSANPWTGMGRNVYRIENVEKIFYSISSASRVDFKGLPPWGPV